MPKAFAPGTALTVGSHQVRVVKYISEGGFATVYLCTIEPAFAGSTTACLKRVVVPNKWQLTLLRQEVDAMKRLRGNHHIVSYIDSHALRLKESLAAAPSGQYEVLLLMEYCAGKGLIDYMNQRLQNRLQEPEILLIMGQITTAVAMCHHLQPPLIHRDIKIENVLLDGHGTYKLCDFGLAVPYALPPASKDDAAALHQDIMQNTTPQYRAPEMIDLSQGFAVDDKLDVWALGVFLYKLCYYTTPFELPHQKLLADLQQAILAAHVRFPLLPQFLGRLQNVISCCLRADPRRRPSALQLLQEISLMQGVALPDVVPYSVRLAKTKPRDKPARDTEASKERPAKTTPPDRTAPPDDVFASIDKSKVLQLRNPEISDRYKTLRTPDLPSAKSSTSLLALSHQKRQVSPIPPARPRQPRPRPKSEVILQDFIHLQIQDADSTDYRPEDSSTLDFLREKDHTGGSFKSLRNNLRRISTGGLLHSQRSGLSVHDEQPVEPKRSIQRRVQALFNSARSKPTRTASGYGRHTEQDDIAAINYTNLSASASTESLGGSHPDPLVAKLDRAQLTTALNAGLHRPDVQEPLPVRKTRTRQSPEQVSSPFKPSHKALKPPVCPPSLRVHSPERELKDDATLVAHTESKHRSPARAEHHGLNGAVKKKPPKPMKPAHLKNLSRQLSDGEMSMPDLDDLEKQFARRYPSYV